MVDLFLKFQEKWHFWNDWWFCRQAGPKKMSFPVYSWTTSWEVMACKGKQACLHRKKLLSQMKSQRSLRFWLPLEPSVGWPWRRELSQLPNQPWCTPHAGAFQACWMVGETALVQSLGKQCVARRENVHLLKKGRTKVWWRLHVWRLFSLTCTINLAPVVSESSLKWSDSVLWCKTGKWKRDVSYLHMLLAPRGLLLKSWCIVQCFVLKKNLLLLWYVNVWLCSGWSSVVKLRDCSGWSSVVTERLYRNTTAQTNCCLILTLESSAERAE